METNQFLYKKKRVVIMVSLFLYSLFHVYSCCGIPFLHKIKNIAFFVFQLVRQTEFFFILSYPS